MAPFRPKYENLPAIFDESVARYADRPLFGTKVRGEWQWMTYGEFGRDVVRLRGALASLGVERGDRVAIIANNRPEWAIGAYAVYSLGAVYVPLYESQKEKDWEYILNDSGAKLVFAANTTIVERLAPLRERLPELAYIVAVEGPRSSATHQWNELLERGKTNEVPGVSPSPDDLAGLLYTSGTTGKPKGVMLTHGNLARNVSALFHVFPMAPEDRSLSFLPWAHSFGQTVELHTLFAMGASMGIAEAVEKIVDNLAEVKPTLLFAVPRIFNRIYDGVQKKMDEEGGFKKKLFDAALSNERYRRKLAAERRSSGLVELKHTVFDRLVFSKIRARFGGRLKYAFSGAAAISREVAEFVDCLGIMVYEGYGLTETSPVATANWPGTRRLGSVGKPLPGVRVEFDTSRTGDPTSGELVVYGHNVMKGYYKLPNDDAEVFTEDRGLRTGDLGYQDKDGFIFITGRIKEQYKLENGKYVAPGPLEEQLKLSPFIVNVMIYGDNRPYNVAVIVPDMEFLKKWAREQGLPALDLPELLARPEVERLFAEQIEHYSSEFKSFEKIRKFVFAPGDFTTANDMLTHSLKVKRRNVIKQYGPQIDALYGG